MSNTWFPSPSAYSIFLSPPVLLGGAGTSTRLGSALSDGREGGPLRALLAVDDAVRETGKIRSLGLGPIASLAVNRPRLLRALPDTAQ